MKKETKQPEVIEGEVIPANTTPAQLKLVTVMDCKREIARVYRDSCQGRIDIKDGMRQVYMLAQIGKLIEVSEFEKRIELLEQTQRNESS